MENELNNFKQSIIKKTLNQNLYRTVLPEHLAAVLFCGFHSIFNTVALSDCGDIESRCLEVQTFLRHFFIST